MLQAKIGVIGGSGLYEIEGLTDIEEINIVTPFGNPSDAFLLGKLNGVSVAFLPRHGRGHRILPSEIPARANIFAMKTLGVEHIIAINSAGSFKEELLPGSMLIPDQVIDLTKGRPCTFFGEGIVAHVSMADPFCSALGEVLYEAGREAGAKIDRGGTFIAMEGPAFSSRAESKLYRSWGADVIGMTVMPEAKLAREAGICYATIACITDFDCWMKRKEAVTMDVIIKCMRNNIAMAKQMIKLAVTRIPDSRKCACSRALENAFVTAPDMIAPDLKRHLAPIIGKYIF